MTDAEISRAKASQIARHMAGGALWMVAMRWVIRVIGLINTAILARLLMPEDFGLVALAMVAVDLAITLTDGDIDMALVRSPDRDPHLSDTGWTLKIASGVITGGLLLASAPFVAAFFDDARLEAILYIAALKPVILGFENIGVIEFRRSLRFAAEFRYLIAQRLVTFVLVLGLVFWLQDYIALALAGPLAAIVTVVLSYVMAPGRPRLSVRRWRELWEFSRWQLLFNASRLIGERCDQVVIGQMFGAGSTGLYSVAFDVAMMPTREIMMPAGRALMPTYARIGDDPQALKSAFAMVLSSAALVASSVGVGVSCVAADAVSVLLGAQWQAAVPFVRWLGLFGAIEGIWLMLDPYLIAARHERILALANLAFSFLMVPAVLLTASRFGIAAIPVCRILVMTICLSGALSRMVTHRWISAVRLAGTIWRPIAAAAVMAAAIHVTHFSGWPQPLLSLIQDVAVGALAYVTSLLFLWWLSGRPEGIEGTLVAGLLARFGH